MFAKQEWIFDLITVLYSTQAHSSFNYQFALEHHLCQSITFNILNLNYQFCQFKNDTMV